MDDRLKSANTAVRFINDPVHGMIDKAESKLMENTWKKVSSAVAHPFFQRVVSAFKDTSIDQLQTLRASAVKEERMLQLTLQHDQGQHKLSPDEKENFQRKIKENQHKIKEIDAEIDYTQNMKVIGRVSIMAPLLDFVVPGLGIAAATKLPLLAVKVGGAAVLLRRKQLMATVRLVGIGTSEGRKLAVKGATVEATHFVKKLLPLD